ncbi:MAG: hypothetical protein QOK04_1270 [Solirubrobacteraceae bacterium]|nr:hypothetical protein [Solirubrobacteraceae bacterium]
MRSFWDRRAAENALYFVDNQLDYRHPDAQDFWGHGEYELDELLDSVGAKVLPTDEVVDIGCGVGRLTRVLAQRGASARAIDVSPEMLRLAREYGRELDNVEWLLGDGVSLGGIADSSADVCISHVVFQHIPDPQITLGYVREIGRVLRPGGWAAFQVSNYPELHHRRTGREALGIRLRALLGLGPKGQTDPAWLGSFIDLEDLRRAADDGAMDVERVTGEGKQLCYVLTRRRP